MSNIGTASGPLDDSRVILELSVDHYMTLCNIGTASWPLDDSRVILELSVDH